MKIKTEIKRHKARLTYKVQKNGIYENFGQAEVMKLEDKYGSYCYGTKEERAQYRLISDFNEWCMNYTGN